MLDRACRDCLGLGFGSPLDGFLELLMQFLQKILLSKERGFVEKVDWVALVLKGSVAG